LRKLSSQVLVGCPRISPQWELLVVSTLMKPKPEKQAALEHKRAEQPWRPGAAEHLREVIDETARRLNVDAPFHWPGHGEYFVVGEWSIEQEDAARGFAVALSAATPELWWVVGRLFVKAGRFFRRRRGYELELSPARDVHLPRELRQTLAGLV
jgi:hypothetical protein